MVTLLSNNACLDVEKEAAMKQAQSASRAAEELMKGGDGSDELKEKLAQRELELNKALKDVASMKAQAENLSSEYDRLCDEKNALERKLAIQGDGDKKR
jgi:B-cell receptor-associated protein 31